VVYRIGLDGTHLYATPSVREVLGHVPGAVVGQRMGERIHPDDRAGVMEMFGRLARGEIDQAKIAFREFPHGVDSTLIWLEANSRLLRDARGRPFEIVAALRDVTHNKTLEFELIEARARAEAATRAKSRFLANLSHEIRTPMNGVIGLADLLLGHPLDPVSRRYVETIAQSGQTMMTLLSDILDIARIDAGRVELTCAPFDLRACLADCLHLMTASAMRQGLDLQQVIAPDVPQRVVGDSLRLRQVLANLIGNAVKFTASGFVRLSAIRAGDRLVITVQDSGIGIAADQQVRLFEEFIQADATVAGVYGGSGLGLAISRRLAEVMGGDLSLHSVPGTGTTLTLNLPIVEPDAEQAAVVAPQPSPICAPGTGLRLLVAEDNHTNRIIMTAMLHRLGHRVDVAGCGEDVLDMVAQADAAGQPFDGVLMDIQMPGMDGLDATRALRRRGHDALRLPVIAVTANGYAEDIDQCRDAGMQGHLVKPVRAATLADELDRLMARRAA
jgi:PAS domain S-box-containing protein